MKSVQKRWERLDKHLKHLEAKIAKIQASSDILAAMVAALVSQLPEAANAELEKKINDIVRLYAKAKTQGENRLSDFDFESTQPPEE